MDDKKPLPTTNSNLSKISREKLSSSYFNNITSDEIKKDKENKRIDQMISKLNTSSTSYSSVSTSSSSIEKDHNEFKKYTDSEYNEHNAKSDTETKQKRAIKAPNELLEEVFFN